MKNQSFKLCYLRLDTPRKLFNPWKRVRFTEEDHRKFRFNAYYLKKTESFMKKFHSKYWSKCRVRRFFGNCIVQWKFFTKLEISSLVKISLLKEFNPFKNAWRLICHCHLFLQNFFVTWLISPIFILVLWLWRTSGI